ncbi:MAG: hypothetical protein IJ272_06350 [Clostridia bacterium]|nr:hypothetical protein [Clostridia bacterium]
MGDIKKGKDKISDVVATFKYELNNKKDMTKRISIIATKMDGLSLFILLGSSFLLIPKKIYSYNLLYVFVCVILDFIFLVCTAGINKYTKLPKTIKFITLTTTIHTLILL